MADHAEEDFDGDIYIYRGGRAPQHITHARIDKSFDEIEREAFRDCENLLTVDTHDGIRRVGKKAFYGCKSLRRINLRSAVDIDLHAFYECDDLESAVLGDRLETIGDGAFFHCYSLKTPLKIPSIITIGDGSFYNCNWLTDIELSERLQTIGRGAFRNCGRLQRIAVPLKRDLFEFSDTYHRYNQFDVCGRLTTVDLVGGTHINETIASLHMESWTSEMIADINRINQVLPNTPHYEKADRIRQWMDLVIDKLDRYKAEHHRYVREGTTLLELALWKAKLGEKEQHAEGETKRAKIDVESYRRDKRMTCGADMVINNVLPFLRLE